MYHLIVNPAAGNGRTLKVCVQAEAELKKRGLEYQTILTERPGHATEIACGIASGAREVMDALMRAIEEVNVTDVAVTTSGCMGLCSREPLVTVEIIGQEPIKYEYMDANKMRQVFKKHVLEGDIQTPFVLARGAEKTK